MTPYQRLESFIESRTNYERKPPSKYTEAAYDLGRMRALLEALGSPERSFASVHIAGSKGKGTTAALTDALLRRMGIATGLYTSPHLEHVGERVVTRGVASDQDALGEAYEAIEQALLRLAAEVPVTFFEVLTALAFVRFRQEGVAVSVLETGLGGRLDATNVVTPLASAITSIGLEHTAQLGSTLAAIAREKAGIVKEGVPVIVGPLPDEAMAVVARIAGERHAPLLGPREVGAREVSLAPGGTTCDLETPGRRIPRARLALLGAPMASNAAIAVALADRAADALGRPRLPDAEVRAVLSEVRVAGRFEVLRGEPPVVLDAAHTRESAEALAASLAAAFPDRRATLVLGAMEDKDLDGILRALLPRASLVVAAPCGSRRERAPEAIAARARALGASAIASDGAGPALAAAQSNARETGAVVVVTGSLYLVGAARALLRSRAPGPSR